MKNQKPAEQIRESVRGQNRKQIRGQNQKQAGQIRERIAAVQEALSAAGSDFALYLSADFHASEYLSAHFRIREALSGFSGSAGTLIISRAKAWLLTDGRYFLQAENELKGSQIELIKSPNWKEFLKNLCEQISWQNENASQQTAQNFVNYSQQITQNFENYSHKFQPKILTDFRCISAHDAQFLSQFAALEHDEITRKIIHLKEQNFHPVYLAKFDRQSPSDRLFSVREKLRELGGEDAAHLISSLDDIAWLCGLRGSDIAHNPVFFAYLFISQQRAILCANKAAFSEQICEHLRAANIELAAYESVFKLAASTQQSLLIDAQKTSYALAKSIQNPRHIARNITVDLKARKSPAELDDIAFAHRQDGAALVRFFAWLEGEIAAGRCVSEEQAAQALAAERAKAADYVSESFAAIVAAGAASAVVHYGARSGHIGARNVLLIDSGAQYHSGTTDITRTILTPQIAAKNENSYQKNTKNIENYSQENSSQNENFSQNLAAHTAAHTAASLCPPPLSDLERKKLADAYTTVLCAHIDMARFVHLAQLSMRDFDAIARANLWRRGWDYRHGTGHGVGKFLCVHEGPQALSIHSAADAPAAAGMLTSIEPGVYFAGRWGLRLEGLYASVPVDFERENERETAARNDETAAQNERETAAEFGEISSFAEHFADGYDAHGKGEFGQFLRFYGLSLYPFERELIIAQRLSDEQLAWLNAYHARVLRELSPLLDAPQREFLAAKCTPITRETAFA